MTFSSVYVVDESMSAWAPKTTARGGLPNISYIARKPKPLGTEFKVIADATTGCFVGIEVQRGKDSMLEQKYVKKIKGKTTACAICLVEKTKKITYCDNSLEKYNSTQISYHDINLEKYMKNDPDYYKQGHDIKYQVVLGDSWFASVHTVVEVYKRKQRHFIWIVKTAHVGFPPKFIMDNFLNVLSVLTCLFLLSLKVYIL